MPVSGKEFCRVLSQNGWYLARVSGSHHIYKHEDLNKIATIPIHGSRDLRYGTYKKLLKDTGLTEDDF
ncbi:hypothetical protein CCB80_02590 [Armatimonadetes bacterium Uphvl-Ar1]|nr:hypothetical protein CCB80_02590 [Armatimonadetes bacterium Uphvl-Ar1]